MNFKLKKFILPLFALLIFVIFPLSVFAQTKSNAQRIVILEQSETVDHDYFTAGNTVTVDGTVNGDAYIAGGQVDINGTINGDLLVAGGQVNVRGKVAQNVRAVGGNVTIEGEVGRNVSAAGGNITLEKSAKVGGNAAFAGGNINVLSPVKDLALAGGNARLESDVSGNVNAAAGSLNLFSESKIGGDLNYWSSNRATIAQGAQIGGKTNYHQTVSPQVRKSNIPFAGISLFFAVVSFISSLILGLLLVWIFPVYSKKTSDFISSRFWQSLLYGFITLVVVPFAVLVLFITLIGIPLALILLFSYFVLIYISKLIVAMAFGKYMAAKAKWKWNVYWTFVLGLVVYYILSVIPVIGFVVKFVVLLLGLGAIVISKKDYIEVLRSKKLI